MASTHNSDLKFPIFPQPPPTFSPPPHSFPSPPNVGPPRNPPPHVGPPRIPPPHSFPSPPNVGPPRTPPPHSFPPPPNVDPPHNPPPKPDLSPPPSPFMSPPPHRSPPPAPRPPPPRPFSPPPLPPAGPGNHSTAIVVVFVSLGGLFFLAFLSVALCCFIKKRRKRMEQKVEIVNLDDRIKVEEEVVRAPGGGKMKILTIEEDIHVDGEIKRSEKAIEGSRVTPANQANIVADITGQQSNHKI